MGACAGSTGGGLKAIRIYILYRQAKNELIKIEINNILEISSELKLYNLKFLKKLKYC